MILVNTDTKLIILIATPALPFKIQIDKILRLMFVHLQVQIILNSSINQTLLFSDFKLCEIEESIRNQKMCPEVKIN